MSQMRVTPRPTGSADPASLSTSPPPIPPPQSDAAPAPGEGPRCFAIAVMIAWVALILAGVMYARQKEVPASIALPVVAAFLTEITFYLCVVIEFPRQWVAERWNDWQIAVALGVSGALPYGLLVLGTGRFDLKEAVVLLGVVVTLSGWFAFWRPVFHRAQGTAKSWATGLLDISFLAICAGLILSGRFREIYRLPDSKLPLETLGNIMVVHVAIGATLMIRHVQGVGLGIIPTRKELLTGLRHFLYFLPIGVPAAWALGQLRFHIPMIPAWQIIGLPFGMFWVVALAEEFLFRGLLQQWIGQWTGKDQLALVLTSLLFGACHLWFRGFPNWRFALVAAIAGWFYGRAFQRGGSIRAPMVTHAIVASAWKMLFS